MAPPPQKNFVDYSAQSNALAAQHNELLKDFKLQHLRIEEQRAQMHAQEEVQARLRLELTQLQGGAQALYVDSRRVDDSVIKNQCARLARATQRFASELSAIDADRPGAVDPEVLDQALKEDFQNPDCQLEQSHKPSLGLRPRLTLRHALSAFLAQEILNCFQISTSRETNKFLYQMHQNLLELQTKSIAPAVWRIQTIRAAPSSPEDQTDLIQSLAEAFEEQFPRLCAIFDESHRRLFAGDVLNAANSLSQMMHGTESSVPLYRAYVPSPGDVLDLHGMDLQKKCAKVEAGGTDTVGTCTVPGIVKLAWASGGGLEMHAVVKKAEVVCACVACPPRPAMRQPAGLLGSQDRHSFGGHSSEGYGSPRSSASGHRSPTNDRYNPPNGSPGLGGSNSYNGNNSYGGGYGRQGIATPTPYQGEPQDSRALVANRQSYRNDNGDFRQPGSSSRSVNSDHWDQQSFHSGARQSIAGSVRGFQDAPPQDFSRVGSPRLSVYSDSRDAPQASGSNRSATSDTWDRQSVATESWDNNHISPGYDDNVGFDDTHGLDAASEAPPPTYFGGFDGERDSKDAIRGAAMGMW